MLPATTPAARLASEDRGPFAPPKPEYRRWLIGTVAGWTAFVGFLLAMSWVFLALARFVIWIGSLIPVDWGLSPALGARVEATGDGFTLDLDEPAYAVAPGQAAVLYENGVVVGCGLVTPAAAA